MQTLRRDIVISDDDQDVLAIDCNDYLDADETVSTATGTEETTTDLTIGSAGALTVNTAAKIVLERSVRIGAVVYGAVRGMKKYNSPYIIKVTINTSAGRKRVVGCEFEVE